jgi:hypothetical protein
MLSVVDRYVIARESNVVRVDFSRDPDPPAPCFPGANGLHLSDTERDADTSTAIASGAAGHGGSRFQSATSAHRYAYVAESERSAGHHELRAQLPNSVRG